MLLVALCFLPMPLCAGPVEQGDSCRALGDTYHAMICYEQALCLRDDAAVRMRLGECHYLRGNYRQCINTMKVVPEDSLSHEALRQIFYSYEQLSDRRPMLYWGSVLVGRYPMDAAVLARQMQTYTLEDEPEKSERLGRAYCRVDSGNVLVLRALSDARFYQRNYREAARGYERLLALGDSTYNVFFSLGMCYEQLDEDIKAYRMLSRAVAVTDSMKPQSLRHLGSLCLKRSLFDQAERCLARSLLLIQPEPALLYLLHNSLGETHYNQQRFTEAIGAWRKALELRPDSYVTCYNIATTSRHIGDRKQARQAYADFLAMARREPKPTDALRQMMMNAEEYLARN